MFKEITEKSKKGHFKIPTRINFDQKMFFTPKLLLYSFYPKMYTEVCTFRCKIKRKKS